jgi:hypothetical protein
MKIRDIIVEEKFRRGIQDATPDMQTWPELDNNNSPYAAYRFGVALAGAPDHATEKTGPIGGQFTTIGYSDADKDILDAAAKMMGVSSNNQTTPGSFETDNVNKKSITVDRGPIILKKK